MRQFRPSTRQIQFLQVLISSEVRGNISEASRRTGIAPSTYWRWRKKPEFIAFERELIDRYADSLLAKAWHSLERRLTKDTNAIKLYFQLQGLLVEEKKISGRLILSWGGEADLPTTPGSEEDS